jgi:hypothetical protein
MSATTVMRRKPTRSTSVPPKNEATTAASALKNAATPDENLFNPDAALKDIEQHKVNLLVAIPSMFRVLPRLEEVGVTVQVRRNAGSACINGGGHLRQSSPLATLQILRELVKLGGFFHPPEGVLILCRRLLC